MAEENRKNYFSNKIALFFSSKKPSVILRRDVTSSRSSPKAISAITSSQHKEYHEEAKPTRNQRMQRRGTSSYQKLEQNQDCMIVSSLPISLIKRAAQKEERESTHQPISAVKILNYLKFEGFYHF